MAVTYKKEYAGVIVTAVNCHEELVAALKATIEVLEDRGVNCDVPKMALRKVEAEQQ